MIFKTMRHYLYWSYLLPLLITFPLAGLAILILLDSQLSQLGMTNTAMGGINLNLTDLRIAIFSILVAGMFLGSLLGWVLVREIEGLLTRVTRAVQRLVQDKQPPPLDEKGPAEFRLLLQSVNELAARLDNLEKSRRRMLSGLLHELGRPISAFKSTLYSLEHGAIYDPELNRELLWGMSAELHRFQRLLDDLAQLNDRDVYEFELKPQKMAMGKWLKETLTIWKETAQSNGIHWRTDIQDDLPSLEFDPDRLGQALGNLLSNAIKFTKPYDAILVQAYPVCGGVTIRVSDTGPGIPPEEQEKIFKPFYQYQKNGMPHTGLGLGLSIARDLVAAHRGSLTVESFPDMGSDFIIFLPTERSKEMPQKALAY